APARARPVARTRTLPARDQGRRRPHPPSHPAPVRLGCRGWSAVLHDALRRGRDAAPSPDPPAAPAVEGQPRPPRVPPRRRLPVADAVTITRDVADALSYAHTHNIVHRDIK